LNIEIAKFLPTFWSRKYLRKSSRVGLRGPGRRGRLVRQERQRDRRDSRVHHAGPGKPNVLLETSNLASKFLPEISNLVSNFLLKTLFWRQFFKKTPSDQSILAFAYRIYI
jgi:hypothetical protein